MAAQPKKPKGRDLNRVVDCEGVVHFEGAPQVVNTAICGNDDNMHDTAQLATCRACIATVRMIWVSTRPPEIGQAAIAKAVQP
jgi:hypothetical protein